MGMAQLVVASVLVEGRSKSEVARTYGVSRRWVITLVQRSLAEGDAGLEPRSRRPRRSPNRTPADLEDEIVEIRKTLAKAGHEAGAATIAFHLERRHGHAPAVSTIWRVLVARGFVTPQPHKRPKSSYVRFWSSPGSPVRETGELQSSETSTSTPPGTTNPSPKRERCPETPVHGVSRHRKWRGDLNLDFRVLPRAAESVGMAPDVLVRGSSVLIRPCG
jgi:transposase